MWVGHRGSIKQKNGIDLWVGTLYERIYAKKKEKTMFKSKPIEVAIDIPSGRIAFADNLRFAYPISEHKGSPQNVDGPLWQKTITEGYGEAGLFHGYVGNSCPSIHRHNSVLIIGNPSYDNYETRDDLPGKHVGGVCTDLWWYSIADYDDLVAHMHEVGDSIDDIRLDGVVKVKPGRYILRHYYPYFSKPRIKHNNGVEIYATIHRSSREIKPFKLPDEGLADLLMEKPDIEYACVKPDGGNDIPIYTAYKIFLHWIGNVFTEPKFTGDEIVNVDLVSKRIYEDYKIERRKSEEQKERLRKLDEGCSKLTLKKQKELLEEILQEMDRKLNKKIKKFEK